MRGEEGARGRESARRCRRSAPRHLKMQLAADGNVFFSYWATRESVGMEETQRWGTAGGEIGVKAKRLCNRSGQGLAKNEGEGRIERSSVSLELDKKMEKFEIK